MVLKGAGDAVTKDAVLLLTHACKCCTLAIELHFKLQLQSSFHCCGKLENLSNFGDTEAKLVGIPGPYKSSL